MASTMASPPPLTQRTQSLKTLDAERNLKRIGWISDNNNEIPDCLGRLIETAKSYSEGNAATQARKEEWQRVQWVTVYLKDCFKETWEDEMVGRITLKVTEGIERRMGEMRSSPATVDILEGLADGLADAIVTSFEKPTLLSKSKTKTHFADVIGNQVKCQLEGPMKDLEKKLEKVESSTLNIALRAHQRVNEAALKMEEATAKMKELEGKLMGTNGIDSKLFGR
ncbi:hypothetical protein BT96DRAFT_1002177 [Gymnopus androsaceus JB14]|uniref:Uncharacterized protein n=1 Tax=Gymnopus androsaceus JB14 TaxID=1447944 RepID=A0A6A4H009_9AGAR|nr:hypothetical protein BT96DRAFT_1002177 [Gymnopus androsaceus JB14]